MIEFRNLEFVYILYYLLYRTSIEAMDLPLNALIALLFSTKGVFTIYTYVQALSIVR